VRFDVYIKNQTGVTYIVELQRRDTLELPKRARYYQAMSDSRQLPKGKAHKYSDLKDNYVIFICLKDIFGHGYYKYSFENTCCEVEGLKLQDGTHKVFFNSQGIKGDICEDVRALLKAIEGETSDNSFVKKLEAAADKIKADEIWREAYMQSLLRDQDTFERGESKKALEIAKKMIQREDSTEDISDLTSLSMDQIEDLKNEMSNPG